MPERGLHRTRGSSTPSARCTLTMSSRLAEHAARVRACLRFPSPHPPAFPRPSPPTSTKIFAAGASPSLILNAMRAFIVACALVLGETRLATGFAPAGGSARTGVVLRHSRAERPFASLRVAASAAAALPAPSPQSPLPAPSPSFAVGSKVLNLYSVFFLVLNVLSLCVAYPLLAVASAWSFLFDRKRRRAIDAVVALWARLCLTLFFFSRVRVEGAEHLPARGQPALFTPNHCSFLDIFALSGFLPRPLKYVSKVEILRIPLIGWAMQLAGHIALRRADRKSQLATFRDSVACLKDGNNLVRPRARPHRTRWRARALACRLAQARPWCAAHARTGHVPGGHTESDGRARPVQGGPVQDGCYRWRACRADLDREHAVRDARLVSLADSARERHEDCRAPADRDARARFGRLVRRGARSCQLRLARMDALRMNLFQPIRPVPSSLFQPGSRPKFGRLSVGLYSKPDRPNKIRKFRTSCRRGKRSEKIRSAVGI